MCRWLAYSGGQIPLSELIFNTRHSLIDQSLHSRMGVEATNGDGFGVGWFTGLETPGMYKSVQPAWNDSNLHDLCDHVCSGLFLAHVRASTGSPVQYTNCHPFRYGKWLFVHNGVVQEHHRLRRRLMRDLDDRYFDHLCGGTDSELMFMLALQFGLDTNPRRAIEHMVGFLEAIAAEAGVESPLQMTLGIADGETLYAVRYSSERNSRSLYMSGHLDAIKEQLEPQRRDVLDRMGPDARCVVSEPLSDLEGFWEPIPESSFITVAGGEVQREELCPAAP